MHGFRSLFASALLGLIMALPSHADDEFSVVYEGADGIGAGKLGLMEAEHGPAWPVMGTLKQALDPGNILNPGKLVPPVG